MKRSGSDWYLEQLLRPVEEAGGEVVDGNPTDAVAALGGLLLPGASQKHRGGCGGVPFADIYCDDLGFEFGDREAISSHPTGGPLSGGDMWSQKHSSVSATIESHSSICAGSPILSHKPEGTENQALGGSSGSDQSDDESLEIDAGSCELGTDVLDIKRMRRMVSNRESARRSRKRKQAHLADLELQVDQLRGENATLYKQLTDANHQFGDAVTNNRVLKSDVEALRVKVKMAEDLVTRGSLACGLDHLLQNSIASNQLLNARHLSRASEISPIMEILQADDACFISGSASAQAQSMASLENLQSRISSEVTSCGGDMWPWDSPTTNVISKQL